MRLVYGSALAITAALLVPAMPGAQQAQQTEANRKVAGGGVTVPGWQGMVDPADKTKGESINNSKLSMTGAAMHLESGPASVYWSPKNVAAGAYTVKGTFREAKQLNDHPHPYGVFIGGKNLDTATQSYMYCAAYGNGTFIFRGFNGPTPTRFGSPRATKHEAIHTFAADGSVTQEVGIRVTPTSVDCVINGTAVASLPIADVVVAGKMTSTDGIYGVRAGHNTDVVVTGFGMTKN